VKTKMTTTAATPRLRRVLTVWDLIFYGIVLVQPIAPVGIFGITEKLSRGHMSTAVLVAMVAMMLTAFSYGRMAGIYSSAGSAYTYVSRALHPHVGALIGWAMVLDYLVIPIVNVIYPALTFRRLFPHIPYAAWAALVTGAIIYMNLIGIRFTARANEVLLAVECAVVVAFVFTAVRFLYHLHGASGLVSLEPFYDPSTFNFGALRTATSLAALTYIGFDGVTTLAEEVENPKRTVPAATVLVCLICGILSTLEVYLGHLAWPTYSTFPNLETAFMDVCLRIGGILLFQAMAMILIIACIGSGLAGMAAAARLLYGMGRDDVLPRKFFAHISAKRQVPVFNVLLVGVLTLAGALVISYERSAELLNFGAFLAFMGVNLSCIRQFYFRREAQRKRNPVTDLIVPGLGFLFCLGIWWSLPAPAKWAGSVWFAVGVAYAAIRTRGFRVEPPKMDFADL
jgi:putrescine importer